MPHLSKILGFCWFCVWIALGTAQASEPTPYPFNTGTKWVYATSEGTDVTLLVEGQSVLQVNDLELQAALVRRSDGADRLIFRSQDRWFECGPLRTLQTVPQCRTPLQFFRWPLEIGTRWTSGSMDFQVMAKEAIEVPFAKYPETWRIAYMPAGAKDPMGEMWMVAGIGRVRIVEQEVRFDLKHFELGQGAPLHQISKQALSLLEDGKPVQPSSSNWRERILSFTGKFGRPWALVFMALLIGIASMFYLGFGLRRAIENKSTEDELNLKPDPQEEAKLLSAIAQGGDFEKARDHFQSLIERNPRYPDLRFQLGLMLRAEGRLDEAQVQFSEALKLNPHYTEARLVLANLLLGVGQHAQAGEEFKMVLHAQPDYADALLGRGKALFHLGERQEAVTCFERALEINPKLEMAQQLLTQCRKNAQES